MKKIYTLSIALALASPLMAESLRVFKCSEDGIPGQTEPQLMGFSISADGHYVCGAIEQAAGFFIADCNSGEVKWKMGGDSGGELRSVDNSGVAIGFGDEGLTFSFTTEETTALKAPAGIRYVLGESISNDGSIMVGSFVAESFNTEAAYSVSGDTWKNLPNPTDAELGLLKDYLSAMSAAKVVSADGNVILGHMGSFTFPVVWTKNQDGEYITDFFPVRYIKATEEDRFDESKPLFGMSGMYTCMSNNGKYIGTIGLIANEEYTDKRVVAVIYDTQEKSLKVYDQPQEIDEWGMGLYPRAIADDGTFIGTVGSPADPAGNLGAFIMRAGQEQAQLYVDAFPVYVKQLGEADMLGQNTPTGISADGRHLLGYTFYSDDYDIASDAPAYYVTYVISLEENAVEEIDSAATSVPQSIYSIDGRPLSRLQKGLNIVRNSDGTVTKILK